MAFAALEGTVVARTVLYCLATLDRDSGHQRLLAEKAGIMVDEVLSDDQRSGLSVAFRDRPQGRCVINRLRAGDVLVVRWVDRLGRNYTDALDTIRALMDRGVVIRILIGDVTLDGSTANPIRKVVREEQLGLIAAMAKAEAEAIRVGQTAGTAAKRERTYRGRKPSYSRQQLRGALDMLYARAGTTEIAKAVGLTRQTVLRIRADPAKAEAALFAWGL